MLTIYTHQVSHRVKYTFNLVFTSILGVDFTITSDIDFFNRCAGTKFSYTWKPITDELFFQSHDLLFETGIKNLPIFHTVKEEGIEKNNDVFAIIFFLASRYEEYQPFIADNYKRFSAKQSFAYKNNFLHRPVVNIWVKKIQEIISAKYPHTAFPQRKYLYTPTIDIDNAYAYLGKNLTRTIGGYVKAISRYDRNDFSKRRNVLSGKEKDPYDTYDLQIKLHDAYSLKSIYFFLLGDWALYDKNLPHTNSRMRSLIKNISEKSETGIHPSFASNQHFPKIKAEKKRLENIIHETVTKSRQHFLMLRFPDTYRNLIASGITDDYSMGFADEVGFRAGMCTPFKFYDLKREEETALTIHPFAVMDGTLNAYLKLSPEQAIEKVKRLVKEVKNVHGEFISIWHNETLSDWKDWKGWRTIYEKIIQEACSE